MTTELRDYQQAAISGLREHYRQGRRRVLVVAPTGSGKTWTFCWTSAKAVEHGRRTLIVVHRIELVQQTAETLRKLGVEPGLIVSGEGEDRRRPVQVAMAQTLSSRIARGNDYDHDVLVIDEAHHAIPGTAWGRILEHHGDKCFVAGYTATPERLDGRGLGEGAGGYFEGLVHGPSVRELISRRLLARPIVYGPPGGGADFGDVRSRAGDYRLEDLDAAVESRVVTGDVIAHYHRHIDRQPAILFATSVQQAHRWASAFAAAGYQAAALEGSTDPHERRRMIRDLGTGHLHVLASCQVISEGTDVPAVAGAIMLRPTKSLALALQQMGRALRPKPGDNTCHILDHVGVVREHGLPQTDRDWTLEGRPRRGKRKDEAAPVRQCTSCWAWVEASARTCPYCGAAKPVKPRAALDETGGELVEITEAKAARKREEWSASSFEQLLKIGRDRGYKNPAFWARKKIEGRNARRRRHG